MADTDDTLEEELDDEPTDDDDAEAVEVPEADPAAPVSDPDVESIEELIAKKEGQADDDPLLSLSREEKLETLAVKVVPPQESEFVCKRCFLVKHQSQLRDKKRTLCRDCA